MKKILLMIVFVSVVAACAFHSKQPIDDNYYKKSQGVEFSKEY